LLLKFSRAFLPPMLAVGFVSLTPFGVMRNLGGRNFKSFLAMALLPENKNGPPGPLRPLLFLVADDHRRPPPHLTDEPPATRLLVYI
jgi:hypothetical protein